MGVLDEYHAALGDLIFRFEGTLERFTGDGLMVFFNDPVRCEDGPARAVRMGVAMRTRVRAPGRGVGAAGPRPRARHRHRPGLRHPGPDRLRGALRLRGDRQRHQPGRPAVRRGGAVADPRHRARPRGRRARRRSATDVGTARAARLQPRDPRVRRQGSRQRQDAVMTGDLDAAGRDGRRALAASTRRSATSRFDPLQARMADVWDAMRLNHDDESVVVIPSITLDRAVARAAASPRPTRSASCSCSCCCASRGCGWST